MEKDDRQKKTPGSTAKRTGDDQNAVELNDTGAGMPLALGGGGYGGSAKTVDGSSDDDDDEDKAPA